MGKSDLSNRVSHVISICFRNLKLMIFCPANEIVNFRLCDQNVSNVWASAILNGNTGIGKIHYHSSLRFCYGRSFLKNYEEKNEGKALNNGLQFFLCPLQECAHYCERLQNSTPNTR